MLKSKKTLGMIIAGLAALYLFNSYHHPKRIISQNPESFPRTNGASFRVNLITYSDKSREIIFETPRDRTVYQDLDGDGKVDRIVGLEMVPLIRTDDYETCKELFDFGDAQMERRFKK